MLPMDGGNLNQELLPKTLAELGSGEAWRMGCRALPTQQRLTAAQTRKARPSAQGDPVGPTQHPEVRALRRKITTSIGGRARHSSQSSELPWINSFHPSNPVREAQY